MPPIPRRSYLALLALIAASCSTPTEEGSALHFGWYSIATLNGAPLPAAIEVTPTCTMNVQAGYLRLSDSLAFELEYSGPITCNGTPINQVWSSYYLGPILTFTDSIIFRLPDLSQLGLDSMRFTGIRERHQRIRAIVPQLPMASGPPVELLFLPTSSDPRSSP